jgi:hypothetical protein
VDRAADAALRELVPRAYFGLGLVYERGPNDRQRAAAYYRQCIALAASTDPEIVDLARRQLEIVTG